MDYTINRPSVDELVLTIVGSDIITFSDKFRRTPETSTESLVVLDLASVRHLTSSAMGQIIGLARRLKTQGRSFELMNPHSDFDELLKSAHLDRYFSVRTRELVSPNPGSRTSIKGDVPADSLPIAEEGKRPWEASMRQFPTITDDDRRFAADWKFAQEQLALGAFESWSGKFLGIYNRNVVVIGDREADIRHEFEATSGISGSQLAVLWIDNDDV